MHLPRSLYPLPQRLWGQEVDVRTIVYLEAVDCLRNGLLKPPQRSKVGEKVTRSRLAETCFGAIEIPTFFSLKTVGLSLVPRWGSFFSARSRLHVGASEFFGAYRRRNHGSLLWPARP